MSGPVVLQLGLLMPGPAEELARKTVRLHSIPVLRGGGFTEPIPKSIRVIASGAPASFISGEVMDDLPSLELIANYGVGYDFIDVKAAAARGIVVTNTPNVVDEDVADMAVGLMLATIREIPQADRFTRAGNWSANPFPLTATLRDRHIGIAGLGRLGKAIARRCAAFNVPISYHGRTEQPGVPYRHYASLIDLAAAVDVLIVTTPGGPATRHLIDACILDALGPNGILVNMARGTVVDENGLIVALREKRILSAGLDVYENEPEVPLALREMPNVVLLPHVGGGTFHTRIAVSQLVVDNVLSWLSGAGPKTPVPETPWKPKPR
jgi:lactate dehydrogenase-like 2-hydroxyacid dehydrogenase